MFSVLEGTLTMRLGEEAVRLGPGVLVCVPPGVVHTFSNRSEEPVRMLSFNTPAGWESSMRELGEALSRGTLPTPGEIGRIASRSDFEVAG
jgi:uncharacterized RmlC-like cupin family protein